MRKKILIISCCLLDLTKVYASEEIKNSSFQAFDNQMSLSYGMSYGNLKDSYGQNSNYGTNFMTVSLERLFDVGVWLRFDGSLMTSYSNYNSSNPNAVTGPLGQNSSVGDLNLKIGYNFPVIDNQLALTPYALIGRNTNLTSNAINNNQTTNPDGTKSLNANVTQDYFLTGGLGARLEYQVDHYWLFYYDQNLIYNSDRSQPTSDYSSANNIQLTSLLGVKANVWDELQIGVSGFYTYSKLTASKTFNQQYELYPQNQVGAMVSLGLTY